MKEFISLYMFIAIYIQTSRWMLIAMLNVIG